MPGRRGGDRAEVDVGGQRHRAGVDAQDRLAAGAVGRRHRRRGGRSGPGRSSAGSRISGRLVAPSTITLVARVEAVHLGQDLVQRLLALVVAAGDVGPAGGARAPDRVELVDEDDRGRRLLGLRGTGHARARRRRRRSSRRTPRPTSGRTGLPPRRRPPGPAASCPVPGWPLSSTPRGIRAPSLRYLSGVLRKSTISVSSSLASSIPATSSNVICWSEASTRRARERPNDISPPAPPAAGRPAGDEHEQQRPAAASGPKPKIRLSRHRRPGARRPGRRSSRRCLCSRLESCELLANDGTWVEKFGRLGTSCVAGG